MKQKPSSSLNYSRFMPGVNPIDIHGVEFLQLWSKIVMSWTLCFWTTPVFA